jgi:hypothetical protein
MWVLLIRFESQDSIGSEQLCLLAQSETLGLVDPPRAGRGIPEAFP